MNDRAGLLRKEYEARGLLEAEMAEDPLDEFREWFAGVAEARLAEPGAFVLATATPGGLPSARAVLMKDLTPEGLVFYTNLESRKSEELRANPRAAATFVWIQLHRQVRFEGSVTELDSVVSDEYFTTRPRGAQIAAHASDQSRPVNTREELNERFAELEKQFAGSDIPRPASWGGWQLHIGTVEFWQGQPNRFHDRVRYVRSDDLWRKERLAP